MRVITGMQPTGSMHLGRYQVLKQFAQMEGEKLFFIADLHAYTSLIQENEKRRSLTYELALDCLACGIDPDDMIFFLQSAVPQHLELAFLLGMITPVSWLERVPTYKEKPGGSYGLLGYPVLQAADILLYQADRVPVGIDQAAHLELTREIARRFNHLFGDTFTIPESVLTAQTVPGLDRRKMSSSYGNAVFITDSSDVIAEKVKQMVTTETKIKRTDPGEPADCVACQLRRLYDPEGYKESWYEDIEGLRGCSQNKEELTEILVKFVSPIQAARAKYAAHPGEVRSYLLQGEKQARLIAESTMDKVRKALG
jgi:tryptophanyl-tRNA synthetase